MNYQLNRKELFNVPAMIMGQMNDYMIERNHRITPAKMITLMNGHLKVIRALYDDKGAIDMAERQLKERVRIYIASLINKDEGTVILSNYPRIELEYRILDKTTIVYRVKFLKNVAETNWVTISNRYLIIKDKVAEEVADLLYAILEDEDETD